MDVSDAFDPESAAANGVELRRLLWMRCKNSDQWSVVSDQRAAIREQRAEKQRRWVSPAWARLEQGLRATDLLLQAGGFAAIVLDLGDTAPEQASRIPLATWFRYRQAAERTQCSLVVIGARGYAKSAATVLLECSARNVEQRGRTVLRGFEFSVRRERERQAPIEITTRKPPAATWQANAAWDQEKRA